MSYLKSGQGYMADYNSPRSRDFNGPRTQVQSSLTTENENSDATQAYRTHKLSLGQKSPHQTSEENETVRSDENKNSAEISDDPETNVSEDSLELPKTITKDHFESSNENNLEDLDSNEHRFGIENMDYGGEDSRLNAFGSIGEPDLDNADDGDFRADSNTLIGELSDFLGTSSWVSIVNTNSMIRDFEVVSKSKVYTLFIKWNSTTVPVFISRNAFTNLKKIEFLQIK